ncbi:MAG: hypothetical protein HY016_00040 [Nitrosomonadales bacterium]|nr:hypothetical protein [Nitrosomonadales bacterium]
MIWIAMLATSFVFIKLGMLLVLVKVLTLGVMGAALVIAGLVGAIIWRKVLSKNRAGNAP